MVVWLLRFKNVSNKYPIFYISLPEVGQMILYIAQLPPAGNFYIKSRLLDDLIAEISKFAQYSAD